jgi:hypothetical protein
MPPNWANTKQENWPIKGNHLKIIVPCVDYYIMCKFASPNKCKCK